MPVSIDTEYAVPHAAEVGTAANQFQIVGLVGGSLGAFDAGNDVLATGQGTLEYVAIPWIGVRASSDLAIPVWGGVQPWSFRLGPSLHLLPYRRVDVGLFFEGGFATVDLFTSRRTAMPIAVGGGVIDIALSASWMVRLEGHLTLGIANTEGAATTYGYATGLVGLGYVL
jgi:hypothetical protein